MSKSRPAALPHQYLLSLPERALRIDERVERRARKCGLRRLSIWRHLWKDFGGTTQLPTGGTAN
jgi:hypothetical protein